MNIAAVNNTAKLPEISYATCLTTGKTIGIKRGEKGYYAIQTPATADELNAAAGVTKAQAEAMYVGSMFGWHVPGANPDNYDEEGRPRK